MTTIEEQFSALSQRVRQAAKKNHDEFEINMEITGGIARVRYDINITETADGHSIAGGSGDTIQEALDQVWNMFPAGLKSWGYTE